MNIINKRLIDSILGNKQKKKTDSKIMGRFVTFLLHAKKLTM